MIESFLITSRETLEASLIIGIVLSYLYHTKNEKYVKTVFYGIFAGLFASAFFAIGFVTLTNGFEGRNESLFEGITMLIGAFLLTTMIFWMSNQKGMKNKLKNKIKAHVDNVNPFLSHWGVFLIIFTAIIREGVETVIFLSAISFSNNISLIASLFGVLFSIGISYLFFQKTKKVPIKTVFKISSVLLILFSSGLIAQGVHELEEAGVLNPIKYPLYNINWFIDENSVLGSFMKGLLGYNGNPSLLELISYWSYLIIILGFYWKTNNKN